MYPSNRYAPHDYKRECDRCGFDFLRSQLQREPDTNFLVCPECLDPKTPLKPVVPRERPFKKE